MIFDAGSLSSSSFSSTRRRVATTVCSFLQSAIINFDRSVGCLVLYPESAAFASAFCSPRDFRVCVQTCCALRRVGCCFIGTRNHKSGWGLFSRASSVAYDQRRLLRSKFWVHTAETHRYSSHFCRSLKLFSSVFGSKGGHIHSELTNSGKGGSRRLIHQESQASSNLGGFSRLRSVASRKNGIALLDMAFMQTHLNESLNRSSRKWEDFSRFNAQKLHSKAASLVPQASKDLKSLKKVVPHSHKGLNKPKMETHGSEKRASPSNMQSDLQISSGASCNPYSSQIAEVLLDQVTKEGSGLLAANEAEKALTFSNISEEMDDSMKKPPKKKKYPLEAQLRFELDMCSKNGDVKKAIDLYEKTIAEGKQKLNQYHYNIVLYLCSSAALGVLEPKKSGSCNAHQASKNHIAESEWDDARKCAHDAEQNGFVSLEGDLGGSMSGLVGKNVMGLTKEVMKLAEDRGFQVYQDMCREGVPRNEATFTAVARLAVAREDGDLAFQTIKEMTASNVSPRLRSYGPALYTYYKKKDIEKAFEVDAHMGQSGILLEESELQVLLRLSVEAGQHERVYSLLHRLRATVRDLAPSTIDVIEQWFKSTAAKKAKVQGGSMPMPEELRSTMVSKGGGWHGLGWLGKGKWKVERTKIDKNGFCQFCGEQLVTIDIDPQETEKFQDSLATLACERAHCGNNFKHFQAWLDHHGPFDYVVDAANVGMYHQNFQGAGFNFFQVNAVVSELKRKHPLGKLPLIILHHKRANEARAATPLAQRQLNEWSNSHAFYSTPTGSNDDWFWLYAAVKNKCLIVTNDEMRDHLFQLLGKDFFPKWKERHQVRFTLNGRGVNFHMPPSYSIVLQESITGSWHAPKSGGDDVFSPREWICITRAHGMSMKQNSSELEHGSVPKSNGKK